MSRLASALLLTCVAFALIASPPKVRAQAKPADPLLSLITEKGTVQIRLYQSDSPKSVGHILALVKRNFYRAQRFHRVEASLVQFGDPQSRDVSLKDWWGRRSSGVIIGVAEFNKRTHVRGAVSLAHGGDPKGADSQLFIMKAASPSLNGKHVVIGQVTSGMPIVDGLKVVDVIKNLTLTPAEAPK